MSYCTGRALYWSHECTDPAVARSFYVDAFGWQIDGTRILVEGRAVADFDRTDGQAAWLTHVGVADLEAAIDLVKEGGGTLRRDITTIDGVGPTARVIDPAGAEFALVEIADTEANEDDEWTSRPTGAEWSSRPTGAEWSSRPTGAEWPDPIGARAWTVLVTPNPDDAIPFYLPLLGWFAEQRDGGSLGPYLVCTRGGVPAAGVIATPSGARDPAFWLSCIRVASVDAATASALAHGAELRRVAETIPDIGRFAVLADPVGARFALLETVAAEVVA